MKHFNLLPERIKNLALKNYKLWKQNPYHPSLQFKEIKNNSNIYSVRIGNGWRVLGIRDNDEIVWFWIGTHSEYDQILKLI